MFDQYFVKERLVEERLVEERPTKLHHYTTAAGLQGILDTKTIWASLATHLNDATEVVRGQRLLWDHAKHWVELAQRLGVEDPSKIPNKVWGDIYVTSFSESENDLGQWRAYAGSRGYMVTMDTSQLPDDVLLTKVTYENHEERIGGLIGQLASFYETFLSGSSEKEKIVKEHLRRGLALAAAVHKPRSFAAEREWRWLLWCEDCKEIGFREREGRIIPFHALPLWSDGQKPPIAQVTIGPGFEPELEKKAVEVLLRRRGLAHIPVVESGVPLRMH